MADRERDQMPPLATEVVDEAGLEAVPAGSKGSDPWPAGRRPWGATEGVVVDSGVACGILTTQRGSQVASEFEAPTAEQRGVALLWLRRLRWVLVPALWPAVLVAAMGFWGAVGMAIRALASAGEGLPSAVSWAAAAPIPVFLVWKQARLTAALRYVERPGGLTRLLRAHRDLWVSVSVLLWLGGVVGLAVLLPSMSTGAP